tara:strand:+ start:5432 stop:5989 length:558 start_codon:yes stop_codon:yes gene_type:complete
MIEKRIKVYDNLFSSQLEDIIEKLCLTQLPYYYTPNIATEQHTILSPGFSHFFINSLSKPHSEKYTPFFNNILYTLSNKLSIVVEQIIAGRVFMHLPSPNPGADTIHTDLDTPHWVALYYINDSDGDTIFFDNNENEIKRVSPKKGRIAFFDGSIPHCSSRPSKSTRVIVNFDFNGTFFGEEKKN